MTATDERVVFASSMEGLWRALTPLTHAETVAFERAGVKGPQPSFAAAYPLQVYMDILDACANGRFAHLDELERYTQIGRLFIDGYSKTMVGTALIGLLRVLGPRRTLERTTRNIRSANNYTEAHLEALAPNHYRVRVNYVVRLGFYAGIIEQCCRAGGAKDLKVTVAEFKDNAPVYEVRWA